MFKQVYHGVVECMPLLPKGNYCLMFSGGGIGLLNLRFTNAEYNTFTTNTIFSNPLNSEMGYVTIRKGESIRIYAVD